MKEERGAITLVEILILVAILCITLGLILGPFKRKPVTPDQFIYYNTVIEGCEYIGFDSSAGYRTWTHKGNCTNHSPN